MPLIQAALGLAAATPADGNPSCRDDDLAGAAAEPAASNASEPAAGNACHATAPDRADRTDPEVEPPLPGPSCQALTRVTGQGPESAGPRDQGPSTQREPAADLAAKLQDAQSG